MIDNTDNPDRPHRRTALIAHELGRFDIDIAALSETRLSGEGSLTEAGEGYTFFWRGYPGGEPRRHGVGLAIKNRLVDRIVEAPVYVSERLMTLRVPLVNSEYITILSCYAPTLDADEEIKDQFYESLHETLCRIKRSDKILLLGDFNARVGRDAEVWEGVIGRNGVGNMNSNGLRLLTLCAQHDLSITNTLFRMRNCLKTSWMHPRSKHWHLIDYIIVRKSDRRAVLQTKAIRGADCWTDHRLIMSRILWKVRPRQRKDNVAPRKLNCEALLDSQTRMEFQNQVLGALSDRREDSTDSGSWASVTKIIRKVAEETIGFKTRKHRDWFDENRTDIHALLAEKNAAHNASLRNPASTALKMRFTELRTTAQRTLRHMQNDWWTKLATEIQNYADTNDAHNFYDSIKQAYGPISQTMVPVRSLDGSALIRDAQGITRRWAEHYSTLLNGGLQPDPSILDLIHQRPLQTAMDVPPTLEEIQGCIKTMKNRKSPGMDGLPTEIFKYGGPAVAGELWEAVCYIWETERVPQEWKDALMISIYKNKGDRSVCGNSRGISLLSVAGKIMARTLLARLIKQISEDILPETQCGFRQNRSTSDMIFVARQVLEKSREQHRELYMAFIDLSKAFDSVDRPLLWEILRRSGCPPKFVRLVQLLHEGMQARVKVGSLESEPFDVTRGVRQGCVLAPVLFNIYVRYVTTLLSERIRDTCGVHLTFRTDRSLFDLQKLKARSKTSGTWFAELQYADDCALVCHTRDALQQGLGAAAEVYARFGLEINTNKTEILCWPGEQQTSLNITINDTTIKTTSSFKYLGSFISDDCKLDNELNSRISQAARSFGRLQDRVFHNHDLRLPTKIKVYEAICLSTLLYGSESWTPYARQIRTLEAWHIKNLRSILGITWRDRITHEEIFRRTGSVSLENYLSRRQLRWLGHVIRMPDDRLPKQALYGQLTVGERSSGGQKKRHKDHMKKVLRKFDLAPESLEELASDRSQWRAACHNGARSFEHGRNERMRERRQRRHEIRPPNQEDVYPCNRCGRVCLSRVGLTSHLRAHQRRDEGRAVVIAADGPP